MWDQSFFFFLLFVCVQSARSFGYNKRHNISKTPLEGKIKGKKTRRQQQCRWMDNIKWWIGTRMTGCTTKARNRPDWRFISVNLPWGAGTRWWWWRPEWNFTSLHINIFVFEVYLFFFFFGMDACTHTHTHTQMLNKTTLLRPYLLKTICITEKTKHQTEIRVNHTDIMITKQKSDNTDKQHAHQFSFAHP